jgi:TolA-binding protein
MFLVIGFFIIVLLICLWLGIKYLLLLNAKRIADKSMNNIFNKINNQYDVIMSLFSQFSVLSLESRNLVQNTKKLIAQAQDFSVEKDGNEIIIAYANTIFENVQKFTDSIIEKTPDDNNVTKYYYQLAVFNKSKEEYNTCAKNLRHYVDTFPTSFFARLKSIKTIDYLND